jgi:hypothetical protein
MDIGGNKEMTTSDKKSSSLMRSAPVLLIVAGILVASPFAMASQQQAGLTSVEQKQANQMLLTQAQTTQFLKGGYKQIGGIIFIPRWSIPVFIEPSSPGLLFADCLPGEFAVSGQYILDGSDMNVLESYAVAIPNGSMVWLMVVKNLNQNQRLPASVGVICASDGGIAKGNSATTVILPPNVQLQINYILNQFIKIENNQLVNLQQIINIKQQITQNAINIAIAGGNVTQIINQSANQIVASNGTNINQIINQTANQVAIQKEEVGHERGNNTEGSTPSGNTSATLGSNTNLIGGTQPSRNLSVGANEGNSTENGVSQVENKGVQSGDQQAAAGNEPLENSTSRSSENSGGTTPATSTTKQVQQLEQQQQPSQSSDGGAQTGQNNDGASSSDNQQLSSQPNNGDNQSEHDSSKSSSSDSGKSTSTANASPDDYSNNHDISNSSKSSKPN